MADVQRALSILRGTPSSYAGAFLSFFGSLALCVYGSHVSEMAVAEKKFFGLAVFFMVAQGFTLAKTYRDRELADLLSSIPTMKASVIALRGTNAWFVQVVISFAIAIAFSFHTLLTAVGDGDTTGDAGFAIYSSAFALISTLSFAKSVRDQADAQMLAQVDMLDDRAKFNKIMQVSKGSSGNLIVVVFGLCIAVVSTIFGALAMDDLVLSMERKGFVVIASLFMMTSSFHLAKLIRDQADPVLAKDVHLAFVFLVWASFAVACTIGFGGVQMMTIPEPKRRFLTNGLLFMLSSTLSTAKLVRDRAEVRKLAKLHQE
mmetsp:Transcript_41558/g.137717  ORF Transcript_41558/g.137717 Transcript_41558/m.137717 type:complete len:317 (+) Transcript_41558:75-1025(+)